MALPVLASMTLPMVSLFTRPLLVYPTAVRLVPKPYWVLVLLAVMVRLAGSIVKVPLV